MRVRLATPRVRAIAKLFSQTIDRFGDVEGPRLGAAFSFYATFSIFPLVLLGVTVLGFVLGDDASVRDRMLSAVAGDTSVKQLVEQTLTAMQKSRSGRGLSFAVSLASLLFGASGALTELDAALNRIWDVPEPKSTGLLATIRAYLHDRFIGVLLVAGIGLTMLASLVTSSVLGGIAAHAPTTWRLVPALLQAAELGASILLLVVVFTATFHLVPRTRPPWRDVLGGAVLTTVGLTILKSVFATYLAHLTSYSAYGVAGGFLALATWIFLSSQVIFFGAQLTRVHCEMTGCAVRKAPKVPPSTGSERPETKAGGGARAPA